MNTDVGTEDPAPVNPGDWRTVSGRRIPESMQPSPIAAMSAAGYAQANLIVSGDGTVLKDRSGQHGDRIDMSIAIERQEVDWVIHDGKAWGLQAWEELLNARQIMDPIVREVIQEINDPDHPLPVDVWWTELTESDVGRTTPKMLEYSGDDQKGVDMVAIGREMADMGNLKCPEGVDESQWLAEIGIHFYIRGKLARSMAAFRSGKMPSDDTVFDIRIYSVMWQRCRDVGFWG